MDATTEALLVNGAIKVVTELLKNRSARKVAAMSKDELRAAVRAIVIRDADELIAEGQKAGGGEVEGEPV